MNNQQIEENKKTIITFLKSTEREGIDDLLEWLETTDYYTAPASTKYHLAEPGGLVTHCLGVLDSLQRIDKAFGLKIPPDSQIITALNHDNCKINLYVWSTSQQKYLHEDHFPYGHGEKSVRLVEKFIILTDLEVQMIRWHMTAYDDSWKRNEWNVQRYFPKAYALYFADHMSTVFLEHSQVKEGCY